MDNSPSTHRPSLVLELPPDRWMYCLACAQPWPCPDSQENPVDFDQLCEDFDFIGPSTTLP